MRKTVHISITVLSINADWNTHNIHIDIKCTIFTVRQINIRRLIIEAQYEGFGKKRTSAYIELNMTCTHEVNMIIHGEIQKQARV